MRRYQFLTKEDVYSALNKLRSAFLAAKDGGEVESIIKGVLTNDERIKIGRRILIAQLLSEENTYDEIKNSLKVGKQTIIQVQKSMESHPECFKLINQREEKVETTFGKKAYVKTGNPKYIKKFIEYTGFTRKDVKR